MEVGLCLWCRSKQENVVKLLEQYASGALSPETDEIATTDLNSCEDCISEYHLARSQVPHLHKELWKLETTRLLTHFSQMCQEKEEDLFVVENNQEEPIKITDFEDKVYIPLIEVLKYPYLLADAKLSDQFLYVLQKAESIEIKEKHKGIYLLLVHPNEEVRSWAIETARNLGRVDRDDFYDVEEVLACMFDVLELGFSVSREIFDPSSACNGKLQCMPTHLYGSNVKNYWLGICMLLTVLDDQAMDSLFLGPNKQTNILQCILNIMEGREYDSTCDPFWPALQCFMVILDRRGPLIWGYIEPIKAFDTIAYSSSYISEIETIRTNGSFVNVKKEIKEEIKDEDLVTCSQMVYNEFHQEKSKRDRKQRTEDFDQKVYEDMGSLCSLLQTDLGQEMHFYKSTFLWFIPFVRSIIKLAEFSIDYVRRVVQYFGDKVGQMVTRSAVWDKITVIFAYLLVHVVDMLVNEGRLDILHACPDIWAKVLVRGAMFTNIAGESVSTVSSSSRKSFGRLAGGVSSSMRNTLTVACLKVLRLILKLGGRQGSDIHPRTFYFLNLLTKHLREVDSVQKGWSLPETEQQDLEKCLKHLAATAAGKVATPPSAPAVVSALSTPSVETVAMESPLVGQVLLKEEFPVKDMDCTGNANAMSIKKTQAGKYQHLKPDLEKLQVICSRLNKDLPKMQAIVQNQPKGEDGDKPPVLLSDERRPLEDQCPSKCDRLASLMSKADDDDGDEEEEEDEPLNAMQRRLIQEKSTGSGEESNMNVSVIVISDEDDCGVERNDLAPWLKIKKEPEDMVESPGRDFDGDLSESQVFEFETQEDLASAWDDAHVDSEGPKASSSKSPFRTDSKTEFVKPKSPPPKAPSNKQKVTVIEAQPLRKKRTPAAHRVTQTNTDAPSTSCGRTSTPAIVPPKKVRKAVEPESTAERLGLKKRKRMAFDLSQRSLDCVDELRRYGQTMQVEEKLKRTRKSNKITSPKMKEKHKKLLPPQERQFFRQSRNQAQKATPASVTKQIFASSPPVQAQKAKPCVGEKGNHEGHEKKADDAVKSMQSCDLYQSSSGGGGGDVPTGGVAEVDGSNKDECHFDDYGTSNLTQMEPTDMELCSQMDLFDEENDDQSIFLTQRDPVDMDIDEDEPLSTVPSLPGDQPNETIQSASLPQLSTAQTPSSLHQSDDSLCLKLGMAQKKTRPGTAKIRTGSSRSETMLKDMEKVPAPKPKTAHQAPMPPPPVPPPKRIPPAQPEFRVPLPPKLPPPRPLPSRPSNKPTPQPPTYKTYPRPEAPTSSSRQSPSTHRFKASILKANVLKWKYSWFQHYKQFGVPEDLCDMPLKRVPETFSSFEDYYHTFFPLLLTNTFEELASDWLSKRLEKLQLKVESVDYGFLDTGLFKVANANFIAPMTPGKECPREDDVVILWLPQNMASRTHFSDEPADCQPHFGIVCRSNVVNAGGRQEMKLKIQTCGNVLSIDKQLVGCELVGSMLSALRELNALCQVHNKVLFYTVLSPAKHFAHFLPASTQLDPGSEFQGCNKDQVKAIECGVSMVMSDQQTPKICMIHGPPGTGKSDTIVNLLYRLSKVRKNFHALVCAPSNAAVDNLMKKVILFFKKKNKDGQPKGNCADINVTRVGSEKTICKKVIDFSLDHQTRSRTEKAQQQLRGIEQKIADVEQNMQNLTLMCAMVKDPEKLAQMRGKNFKLNEERERLSQQKKQYNIGRQNTQRLILQEANVIFCTLNTSGSLLLESAFRRRGRLPFDCVIADEAGQAKELETLIPLVFCCPSLILVGDPEQLPPTVISQKAKELGYDQSLMARLYKCMYRLSPPRIHFLSQQYRMHPDICSFPSSFIYNNFLKTDRTTALNRCSGDWPCVSYRVFDVTDGQEMRKEDSYCNPKEVKLTVELVRLVIERYQSRGPQSLHGVIGVITPYSVQKTEIYRALYAEGLREVVVDTVDGFQGREMNCIIVSCVRASDEKGSIGFLGTRHRINVSITRAKYSLFVLGHVCTLRENRDWRALLDDADSRGIIITTKEKHFKTDALKVFKREPQFSRSHSTPPFPNYSRTSSTSRAPQPTKASRDPRTNRASSYPAPPRASSYPAPPRSAPSMTARRPNPTDLTRDLQLPGSSSNYDPSSHHLSRANRDRHVTFETGESAVPHWQRLPGHPPGPSR